MQGYDGLLHNYYQDNGDSSWGLQSPAITSSAPAVTDNNGMVNLTGVGSNGELDFYWTDSADSYHKEQVAAPGWNL